MSEGVGGCNLRLVILLHSILRISMLLSGVLLKICIVLHTIYMDIWHYMPFGIVPLLDVKCNNMIINTIMSFEIVTLHIDLFNMFRFSK